MRTQMYGWIKLAEYDSSGEILRVIENLYAEKVYNITTQSGLFGHHFLTISEIVKQL